MASFYKEQRVSSWFTGFKSFYSKSSKHEYPSSFNGNGIAESFDFTLEETDD